jgi:release factor glutamine methyltransferase
MPVMHRTRRLKHTTGQRGGLLRVSVVVHDMVNQLEPMLGTYALPYTERILQHVLSCTRTQLYLESGREIDTMMQRRIDAIIDRCHTHEPLDYIIGTTYFYDREFTVSPAVLVPRPDTEVLIETVLRSEPGENALFADVGVGSGIISCILTEKKVGWFAVGIDRSIDALHIAQINSRSDRVALVCADVFCAFSGKRRFDFIVSNPPYIPTGGIDKLDKSVRCFEPRLALDGGDDGLAFYRSLAAKAPSFLKSGGSLYCEIGYDQEKRVRNLFSTSGWNFITCIKDLAGHSRVVWVRYEA